MHMKILLWSTILIFAITAGCKESPVESLPDDNSTPGRRDYAWSADTIKAYYIYFNSIWGKKVEDLWAVSLVGSATENIYRYNGGQWYRETRMPIYNTVSLWGTENNLWICTKDGYIWNYKNDVFSPSTQFLYKGSEIDFFSMAGKTDNEVYAGGDQKEFFSRDAILYKYNGINWQLNRIIKNNGAVIRVRYSSLNNSYYLLTVLDNETLSDTVRLHEYKNNNSKIIYQNYISENTSCVMNDINGSMYVTIGKKISIYYKDRFYDLLEINNPNFGGQLWGRNRNDLFIRMFDGLMHYNGTDLQYILKFPQGVRFGTSALVLEKDIFLHAFDDKSGYNIIYHGKLKEN